MERVVRFEGAVTSWVVLAKDGTGYASLALLHAAGKQPYNGGSVSEGVYPLSLAFATATSAGADGSPFLFAVNRGAEFAALASDNARDQQATLAPGGGHRTAYPGLSDVKKVPISNVWVRKTAASDYLYVTGANG